MKQIVFCLPGNEALGKDIIAGLAAETGHAETRRFPDGESYVRLLSDVKDKQAIVLCTLDRPDDKLPMLYFLCRLLKDSGATDITLVAPYLSYMRQDKAFHPGEAVSSRYFAAWISSFIDRLITVDPHLHRIARLEEIYSIPCESLHAGPPLADWIRENVSQPLIIGPDSESEQWVSKVAAQCNAPFVVLDKVRSGDRSVRISIPALDAYKEHTPVLLDDIISTAHTMIETVKLLKQAGMKPAVCVGIHAVFAGEAWEELKESGVQQIITANTILHRSNQIDLAKLFIGALK